MPSGQATVMSSVDTVMVTPPGRSVRPALSASGWPSSVATCGSPRCEVVSSPKASTEGPTRAATPRLNVTSDAWSPTRIRVKRACTRKSSVVDSAST